MSPTLLSIAGQKIGPSFTFFSLNIQNKESAKQHSGGEGVEDLVVPWHDLPDSPFVSAFLSWRSRMSRFNGRDEEMDKLLAWAVSNHSISITFICGAGGSGKSRLAAEFASVLQQKGWAAGFVPFSERKKYWAHSEGTLLVVDYPEEHLEIVAEFLRDVANLRIAGKLRILFLTRQTIEEWNSVLKSTRTDTLTESEPIKLQQVSDIAVHEIFLSTAEKVGDKKETCWQPVDQEAMTAWREELPQNGLPLFILAAAVYNVIYPDDSVIQYTGPEIMLALANREIARLRNVAENNGIQDQYIFARLLSISTISGGILKGDIDDLLSVADTSNQLSEHTDKERLVFDAGLLSENGIDPLTPDILGAIFVAEVLSKKPSFAPEIVWSAVSKNFATGLYRLGRMDYDVQIIISSNSFDICDSLSKAVEICTSRARLLAPFISLSSLPIGLWPTAILTFRTMLSDSDLSSEERAYCENNLSVMLSNTGQREEAMGACQRAVEIYERLADRNPEAFLPDLASSLNNLGIFYSELGQREEAMGACQRAVEIYERLTDRNPEAFLPALASSLNNLGNRYSELGQREEAMGACQRAVEIPERLADRNPEAFLPDLAMSLNNLGTFYSELGQREEAMGACQRAVEIRERLADRNPEAFLPALASSLNNLGNSYSELGQREEAMGACQRAVEIYERLADRNPEAFLPDLAMSLNNLGTFYSELGQREEAMGACQRA
ncbi:MAG: tetratricopeptide repeat protein, partial [Desulfobulbus sp.]|nr:tetratricopeptide repeat protein [Desulfobulbus sp.]